MRESRWTLLAKPFGGPTNARIVKHWRGVAFMLPVLLAVMWASAGVVSALSALATWLLFGLPGLVGLRFDHKPMSGHDVFIRLVAGVAASCCCILILGGLSGRFTPLIWFSAVGIATFTIALAGRFETRRWRHGSGSGMCSPAIATASCIDIEPKGFTYASILATGLLLLIALPIIEAGQSIAEGLAFRSFFNADFFKHMAIAGSIASGNFPPVDPFGATHSLHYYWLQHLLPAAAIQLQGLPVSPLASSKAIGLIQSASLAILIHAAAMRAGASARGAALAAMLGFASLSLDGLPLIHAATPESWLLQDVNQESMDFTDLIGAPWHNAGSSLFRFCLYVPQHQLCMLFFLAWYCLRADGESVLLRWPLLVLLPATSVLLGGVLYLGIIVAAIGQRWHKGGEPVPPSWAELFSGCAVGLALPFMLGMVELGARNVGMAAVSLEQPSIFERLLWFAPQWLGILGGLFFVACWRRNGAPFRSDQQMLNWGVFVAATVVAVVAATLPVGGHLAIDLQLKASFAALVALVLLASRPLSAMLDRWRVLVMSISILIGLPAMAHDWWWHRCLLDTCAASENTVVVPHADEQALAWIRTNLANDAVMQEFPEADFNAGGRDVWIPVLGRRAVLYSTRGTMVDSEQLDYARRLFSLAPPSVMTSRIADARRRGIDFLYLSRAKQAREYRTLRNRFSQQSNLRLVYESDDVTIWQLHGL